MSVIRSPGVSLGVLLGVIFSHITETLGHESVALGASSAMVTTDRQSIHTSEQFTFLPNAPLADVFPLLGADRERVWAPGWEPRFVWPVTPRDQAGMVFQIPHGDKVATWVNTVLDPVSGRIQYVYVLPEVVATVITLQLHARGAATEVIVRYERTSLSPEADAAVKMMAEHDRAAGPEWASQINAYLSTSGKP
jgi:hypothetical protein